MNGLQDHRSSGKRSSYQGGSTEKIQYLIDMSTVWEEEKRQYKGGWMVNKLPISLIFLELFSNKLSVSDKKTIYFSFEI